VSLIVTRPAKKQPEPLCKWAWVQAGTGYRLEAAHVLATLKPLNDIGDWRMALKYRGKWHTGIRQGLEQAFKAIDGLLAKKSKAVWLETNVHAVIEPWMGDLNFDVDKTDE